MPSDERDPSPQDPNRFVEGGNAPLDAGPDATPSDVAEDPGDDASLPPGAHGGNEVPQEAED